MTKEKENPNKDIDDFLKRVYDEEITKINPAASTLTMNFKIHNRAIAGDYPIAALLDEYVPRYRNWIKPVSTELSDYVTDLQYRMASRYRSPNISDLKPRAQDNPWAGYLRPIIRALKSRGLLEESKAADVKCVEALDELQKRTAKLEELSDSFEQQQKTLEDTKQRLADKEQEIRDAYRQIDELRQKVKEVENKS